MRINSQVNGVYNDLEMDSQHLLVDLELYRTYIYTANVHR